MWKRFLLIFRIVFFFSLLSSYKNLYGQVKADFSASTVSGCSPITVIFSNLSTGATAWQWDLGNGTISNLKEPSATYIAPGSYTVKLTASNGNSGDAITKTNFITVYASPIAAFGAGATTGCYPLSVPFTDQSTAGNGTITSWQWDFGDGSISALQNPTHVYQSTGKFNVILTVTNSYGCVTTIAKQNLISISNGAIAYFDNSSASACAVPTLVSFNNYSPNYSVGAAITGYFWDFGDGQTSTEFLPTHLYISAGVYTVSLTVNTANGCSNTIVRQSQVMVGIVKADFSIPSIVCAGASFNISNLSKPDAGLTHCDWDFGDGTSDTLVNPTKKYSVPGTYLVTLKADYGSCSDVTTRYITVIKSSPTFTASIIAACLPPITATFTNTSADATVVLWDFGDGTTSRLANPTHTYTAMGDYNVKLTSVNSNGCIGSTSMPSLIHIGPPKILKINGAPYRGCIPYNASFSALVQPAGMAVSYNWDFGDGTTSTLANPSHIYPSEGNYNLKLIVTAVNGGCSDTLTMPNAVVVGIKPHADFIATPLVVCEGEHVFFTNQSNGGANDYTWFFGDKTSSSLSDPVHDYIDTGYQTVTLVATRNGCTDTLTKIDYVYVKPPIVGLSDSFLCSNQFQHFFSSQTPPNSNFQFQWNFGDGATSTLANPSHLYADTGRYNVKLTINATGCLADHLDIFIVNEDADFTMADSMACGSFSKIFNAKTHSPYRISYNWDFGDGNTAFDSINSFINHTYAAKGNYNVKLTILDSNKCFTSLTKPLVVNKYGPTADFSVPISVCRNSPIIFTDLSTSNPNKIIEWTWDFGDTSAAPKTYSAPPFANTYKRNGYYDVQLIVKDETGCRDTVYKPEILQVKGPIANFGAQTVIVCLNKPLFFLNQSIGDSLSYYWDFGDGTFSTVSSSLFHQFGNPGFYAITLSVTDKYGCTDTATSPLPIHALNAQADFLMSDSISNCPPLLVNYTNRSLNAASMVWDFGDGNTSNVLNPSHTYTMTGSFNVKLIVTGSGGCTDSIIRHVEIGGPKGSLKYDPILGCTPLNVHFSNNTFNAAFYTWDFDDGFAVRNKNIVETHTYATLGTYLPKIILEDSVGCKVPIYGLDSIKVKGVEAHVQQLQTFLICDSGLVAFKDSAITNDVIKSFLWSFGDGQTSNQENPVHKYAISGNYVINYIITTLAGCIGADTLKVPIKVTPSPNIAFASPASFCVPANIEFNGQWLNTDTSILIWKWDFSNGNVSNLQNPASQIYNKPGNYTISSIATNGSGCADTVIHVLTVFPLPTVNAGPDNFICLGKSANLNATGALSYSWQNQPSLSCLECANPIATPSLNQLYIVIGTDMHGCIATDSLLVKVKLPFIMAINRGDTMCFGQSYMLNASGAEKYVWSPATFLNNPSIANPISTPDTSVRYRVVGSDTLGCFVDTGFIGIKVYPIPKVNIIEEKVTVTAGSTLQLHTSISSDVTSMHWSPAIGLSCVNCPNPIASPKEDITYTLTVTNAGSCKAKDDVDLLVVCGQGNIFIPNTFSPNNDGVNDVFYPRGRGIYGIKGMRIFSRWGELIYEKTNFQLNDISSGWDGSLKGQKLTPDVYVYIVEVICVNNKIFTLKGNVTLLK